MSERSDQELIRSLTITVFERLNPFYLILKPNHFSFLKVYFKTVLFRFVRNFNF